MLVLLYLWAIVAIAAHITLTLIVYRDAKTLPQLALNISPFLWGSISFTLPIGGMFIYWLMNHSYLSNKKFRI